MPTHRKWLPPRKRASMCCCRPEFRKTLHDVGQERAPGLTGVLPGWRGHYCRETQNLKVASLACSRPKKWTRCLQGPGTKSCVVARQAGWWGPEGLTGKAKESHLLVQPHHQDCNHDIDGNLQVHQNDGAKTGQLGGLVPAVHLISMSISHMTHDSIEEVFQGPATRMPRRVNFFHHQVCGPIAILIDLGGVGMDDSLAPLRRLERGKCLEIWCGGARGELVPNDWYI